MSVTETIPLNRSFPKRKLGAFVASTDYAFIKKLIWTYFLLLLFEGALRKWFLPGLSQGLLIIRDPIVIWIYYLCYTRGIFPLNKYILKCFQWVAVAGIISLLINKTNPFVILFGIRTNLLHFPLIFVMARILSWKDVIDFGKAFLFLALPMTWIVAEQFQADRFNTLNVAAGGTGHQMMTSGDKVRASGTFSFVSGIVFYYCFAVAYIIYGFMSRNTFSKWLLYLGTSASLLAMVTAGSRAVIAECLQVVACVGFLAYYKPTEFKKIAPSIFGFSTFALILYYQIDLFEEGLNFLSLRFEEAANIEGNPVEAYFKRYQDMVMSPYYYSQWIGFWGSGLGMATRAGATLAGGVGGAEIGWSRQIIESGPLVGCLFIVWRIWIIKDLLLTCLQSIKKGHYLCIFLWGASAPILLFTPLGQPTNLGFATFGCGLCLTAAVAPRKNY